MSQGVVASLSERIRSQVRDGERALHLLYQYVFLAVRLRRQAEALEGYAQCLEAAQAYGRLCERLLLRLDPSLTLPITEAALASAPVCVCVVCARIYVCAYVLYRRITANVGILA